MKYLKIQQDILKEALNGGGKFLMGAYKDSIAMTDGFVMWLIPKQMFMLDLESLKSKGIRSLDVTSLLDYDGSQYKDAVCTSDLKKQGNSIVLNIKSEAEDAWVDMKLLKYYDNPQFKVSGKHNALMVFEEEELAGLVLPVRMPEPV